MDEYSVSHQEAEHEPKRGRWPVDASFRRDRAISDIDTAIRALKREIYDCGPLHTMQQLRAQSLIKDLEQLTRGRWVA